MRNPLSSSPFRSTPYWLNFVFSGQAYMAWATKTVVSGGGTSFIVIRTPALGPSGRLAHFLQFQFSFFGGGPLQIDYFENPVVTVAGTPFPIDPVGAGSATGISNWDRRWEGIRPPTTTFEDNPTVNLAAANHIRRFFIPASGPNAAAGGAAFNLERVLQPSQIYAIRFTNQGSQNIDNLFAEMIWYESGN